MFGGGEEYFREPPSIDRDTLRRFALFCARLRAAEKPGKKTVAESAELARGVGDNEMAFELVVGALFRHIKSWTGNKQLACWYILDKLCKEDRDKYGYTASKYILEIGRDYIPFEDPVLGPKYESLVEHWEGVFPSHVVDALWLAKKDRLWAIEHPNEVLQQKEEEERQWKLEEMAMEDEDGLNDYGQPCMDYLQGRCFWGDACRLYHPPGEEGTMPLECRLGDWKCSSCGAINRHFQRRCSSCVREKPQYKKGRKPTAEEALLSSPDPNVYAVLRRQFGYDPNVVEEAVAHWKTRLETTSIEEYKEERRAAYRMRILGRAPTSKLEESIRLQKNYPDIDIGLPEDVVDPCAAPGRMENESLLPAGTSPVSAVGLLAQTIVERGARDPKLPQLLFELAHQVKQVARDSGIKLSLTQCETLMTACKIVFSAWGADRGATPFVPLFFKELRHTEDGLGLSTEQQEHLTSITKEFCTH
ncbi:putative ZFP family member [Trypanosoma cruzi]|uniref:Putative ZFP family member n=1 Tax=Trypanosoma cruzi TaxID=5693 RepID=A0A2V2WR01_TRYCR|nr:putative ZFP family member [Trypanosoma cruzi]